MKKMLYFMFLGTLFIACHKNVYEGEKPDSKFSIPADFEWKTLNRKMVTLTETSSVYLEKMNQAGEVEKLLLGDALEPGEYSFAVSNFSGKIVTEPVVDLARSASRADDRKNYVYFPSANTEATMIFEDLFPETGDLDMNDVVFDFRVSYKLDKNGNNGKDQRVLELTIDVWPRAMGGKFYSSVGLAANLIADNFKISGVEYTGTTAEGQLFDLESDGTEVGASSVIPLCANLYDCYGGKTGILNTDKDEIHVDPSFFSVKIKFSHKPLYSQLNLEKDASGNLLDLFIVLGSREREIHRKNCPPTSKFGQEFLTENSNNVNFCSKSNNYVWALIFDYSFKYPIERKAIYEAYPNFTDWVQGNWTDDANPWYMNQKGYYLY